MEGMEGDGAVQTSLVVLDEGVDPTQFVVKVHFEREAGEDDGEAEGERLATEETPAEEKVEEVEDGVPPLNDVGGAIAVSSHPLEEAEAETATEDESDSTPLVALKGEDGKEPGEGMMAPGLEERKKMSSIIGASFNFTNSIIGAGIIGIPAAIRLSGFLPGVLLLVMVAVITNYTVLLLIKNGIISGKFSYQEMITAAFKKPGFWLLTVIQLLFPFFGMAGYVVIVGDTLSRIIEQLFVSFGSDPPSWVVDTSLVKVIAIVMVMLPISLLRNIAMLEKFSALAVLCVVAIVLFTVVRIGTYFCAVRCFQPACCNTPLTIWGINSDFVESVGIMAFAFVCHHNTYLIYASLHQRSLTRFSHVSHISVSASFLFCLTLGVAGFITFMNETRGDLLNNYCVDDQPANIARFFYACVIMLTYPIEIFVCREVLEIMLSKLPYKVVSWIPYHPVKRALDRFLFSPRHTSLPRHVVLTVLLVVGSLLIGISTNDLGVVLGFTGCLMATPMAFILPTASYLRLSTRGRWYHGDRLAAWAVLIIGVIVMVIGTGLAVAQAVRSYTHQSETHPPYCPSPLSSMDTCCSLLSSTHNLTSPAPLCDCTAFCSNHSILLSPDLYCW